MIRIARTVIHELVQRYSDVPGTAIVPIDLATLRLVEQELLDLRRPPPKQPKAKQYRWRMLDATAPRT